MALGLISFLVVFFLVASGALAFFHRPGLPRRIANAVDPTTQAGSLLDTFHETGTSLGEVVGHFQSVLPKSRAEISVVLQRLVRAGYRNEAAVSVFYGTKVLLPALFCAIAFATGLASTSPFMIYASALGVGFLLPDFWLGRRITKRQSRIVRGLPDVLDLLVICIEAGLSLDQATNRTTAELAQAQPELCDELRIVVLEQRAGRSRSDAWRSMAERTGVDSLRNLVSVLVQSEQFGTSIAKTLRIHGDALRSQRVQRVEEQAAKTSTKLVFPLVLFIFPSLFLVTLGPAVILMMDSFNALETH